MATTTLRDSGLLSVLLPELQNDTGLEVQLVAFGTGKVLRSAADGNADVILVHDPVAELEFMELGYGSDRIPLFRNDFIIVGPENDPANISNSETAKDAFQKIKQSEQSFVSRADSSGTHQAELRIWNAAGILTDEISSGNYFETGTGMGRTINVAVEKSAYLLVDRATWLTFQNRGSLAILYANDPLLENIYSLILPNTERHTHISPNSQQLIIDWFRSAKARDLVDTYQIENQKLFYILNNF